MDEKELNQLLDQTTKAVSDKIKSAIEAAKEDNQKEVTSLKTDLLNELGPDSPHVKAMQEQLDQISLDNKDRKSEMEGKTFSDHVSDFAKSDDFKNIASETKQGKAIYRIPFQAKVATMLNSGQSGAIPFPTLDPGVSKTSDIPVFLFPMCNIGGTISDTIYYVDRSARTAGAAVAAEGVALGQSDMTYTQRSVSVFDVGTFITISKQMVQDNDFVQSEINGELTPMVLRKLDYDILNGTGTTEFDGIVNRGTTVSVAGLTFAGGIPNANNFDVLRVAVALCRKNNQQPDAILVSVDDYAMMELSKDGSGAYTIPPFYGPGIMISGVRVLPNTLITTGTFVVCDMNKAKLRMRQDMLVEAWYQHSDNATKRLLTITAYLRAAFYISAEHTTAFQKGSFDTVRLAINKS